MISDSIDATVVVDAVVERSLAKCIRQIPFDRRLWGDAVKTHGLNNP